MMLSCIMKALVNGSQPAVVITVFTEKDDNSVIFTDETNVIESYTGSQDIKNYNRILSKASL